MSAWRAREFPEPMRNNSPPHASDLGASKSPPRVSRWGARRGDRSGLDCYGSSDLRRLLWLLPPSVRRRGAFGITVANFLAIYVCRFEFFRNFPAASQAFALGAVA